MQRSSDASIDIGANIYTGVTCEIDLIESIHLRLL